MNYASSCAFGDEIEEIANCSVDYHFRRTQIPHFFDIFDPSFIPILISHFRLLCPMYLYISFLLFAIPSIAEENLFLDDASSGSDSLAMEFSSNYVPLNDFDPTVSDPPFTIGDLQSSNDDGDIFSPESVSLLKDPLTIESSASDDVGALDIFSCSSDPSVASKRVKSRNAADTCNVKSPAVYLPDDFYDLAGDVQKKFFDDSMCPSSDYRFKVAQTPVCSSRLPENTRRGITYYTHAPRIIDPGPYYTLRDSFPCTYRFALAHHVGKT